MAGTNAHIEQFLGLRCAPDVLAAVSPMNQPSKEISEAMAAMRYVKRVVFDFGPMQTNLVDLCAGNAIGSILAVHLLPIHQALAVDKSPHKRPGMGQVQRWYYRKADILTGGVPFLVSNYFRDNRPVIYMSIHPCQELARAVIAAYREDPFAKALVMLPCCEGEKRMVWPQEAAKKISSYEQWAIELTQEAGGTYYRDMSCLSEKNIVIVASKPSIKGALSAVPVMPQPPSLAKYGKLYHPYPVNKAKCKE